MIYLEAPAGVGYSYAADGNITTSDDDVSNFEFPHLFRMYILSFAQGVNNIFCTPITNNV